MEANLAYLWYTFLMMPVYKENIIMARNSLSPKRQMELMSFLEDSARFFGCQFIISTHSPFLLSMRGARIYNLDKNPVTIERWTDLENVRTYFDFFRTHEKEFQSD